MAKVEQFASLFEFALLMPGIPLEWAETVCSRFLERLSDLVLIWEGEEIRVTASAGLAELRDNGDATLQRDDAAFYCSESSGRATLSRAVGSACRTLAERPAE